ncbi:MAG: adenylyl-sulfate kinase [Bacteroidota bacterium]|jgi:adenylylsulfate kinase|nr:adenylyl-sulfate kinase [Saprospiraceae bacterium]
MNNIYPVFDYMLSRAERERALGQRARVLWFTGLSGSGKTTIAVALERKLFEMGRFAQILDGDNIRSGINSNLGFSPADRTENIRRVAEISKLYLNSGIICINCFISPKSEMRELARNIIGREDFTEVFIDTPLEVCEKRDPKGLYRKARAGLIPHFTGIDDEYEPPLNPDIVVNANLLSVEEAVDKILAEIS